MDEEELHQAALIADLTLAKPEEAQHLGDGGCGHAQVREGQHAEEQEHGLMQGPLHADGEQDGAVPQDGEEVHGGEGNGDPSVLVLHPRNALENEEGRMALGDIAGSHGGALVESMRKARKEGHEPYFITNQDIHNRNEMCDIKIHKNDSKIRIIYLVAW